MANAAAPATTSTWASIRCSFHSLTALLIAAVVLTVTYLSRDSPPHPEAANGTVLHPRLTSAQSQSPQPPSDGQCDMFSGRWVYDNVSYPLYKEQDCKFMSDQVACEKFGREDLGYRNWRWQPDGCDLPRFNATAMLERLRNKRMVFVGDSLNRGQWVSMICLVESAIVDPSLKSMDYHLNGSLLTFQAQEYNASIEFYWEPLLVESNCDYPYHPNFPSKIVRVQAIEKHAKHWSNADFLIFDSYEWWRKSEMNVLWGSFDSPDGIYKVIPMRRAVEIALTTWANWLEIHINTNKTQMFFMTSSPTHVKAEDWGGREGQNCYQETNLITNQDYQRTSSEPEIMQAVKSVVQSLETRGVIVQMINITRLSEYRKDAHPTIYRRHWRPLTEEEKANPVNLADCMHWCLPGVPDVWNVLLYAHIFQNQTLKLN